MQLMQALTAPASPTSASGASPSSLPDHAPGVAHHMPGAANGDAPRPDTVGATVGTDNEVDAEAVAAVGVGGQGVDSEGPAGAVGPEAAEQVCMLCFARFPVRLMVLVSVGELGIPVGKVLIWKGKLVRPEMRVMVFEWQAGEA